MSDQTVCLAAFIVIVLAVIALFYIGSRSNSSGQLSLKDWKEFYGFFRKSEKASEKIFVVFAYSALILKTSFMGAVAAVSLAGFTGAAAVCGQSPWPYIKELLLWIGDFQTDTTPSSDTTKL